MTRNRKLLERLARLTPEQRRALRAKVAGTPAGSARPDLVCVDRSGTMPLSYAQERLWFLHRLMPTSAAYHMASVLRLEGKLDVAALEGALTDLVARHEVLRTRLLDSPDGPVQTVEHSVELRLPVEAVDDEHAARQRAAALVAEPFDLRAPPLLRARLLELGPSDHVLVFVTHHVVSDGLSLRILVRDWSELYAARLDGRPPRLEPLPVQYADYAVWQRRWLDDGGELERQLGYWQKRLAGLPAVLDLPLDHARPKVKGDRGASVRVRLGAELMEGVHALARAESVTPFMVLLAAWQLLLGRYARSDDVTVGTPIAGRRVAEVEDLIGFFVNTLVLRTDLGGDPTFRELVRRAKAVTLDAFAHQDVPFEKLLSELGVARDTSVTPLFQVMFSFHSEAESGLMEGAPLPGLRVSSVESPTGTEPFDLTLTLFASGRGTLTYDADLFAPETIERIGAQLQRVVERCVGLPDAPLSQQTRNGPEDEAWLASLAVSAAPPTEPALLPEVLRARAMTTPSAVLAGMETGERWTYDEVDRAADGLARSLVARGVRVEERVGLCVGPGVERLVGAFGIWRAGAAYVPLDPSYPAGRLRAMIEDAGLRRCVCGPGISSPVPSLDVIDVRSDAEGPGLPELSRELCAYVIYTSGSTGRPKGVAVEHGSLAAHAAAIESCLEITSADRGSQLTGISFDVSLEEIGPLLRAGGSVWSRPDGMTSPAEVLAWARACGVTVLQLPAPFWHEMVRALPAELPPTIRAVVVGSDRMSPEACRRWCDEVSSAVALYNAYGPTESTVTSSVWRARREELCSSVPVGRPTPHVRVRTLDADGSETLRGARGEIVAAGPGVARGYLDRPRETAERFVPDAWGPPGARSYRTGDLGWWSRHGQLMFAGRDDSQVKLRGFRVELGEVESHIEAIDGVEHAVCDVRGAAHLTRLVAWLRCRQAAPGAEEIRQILSRSLPAYMVPSAFVVLDALPTTPSGKVDRRSLPEPEWTSEIGYEAPSTPTEAALALIWRDLLQVPKVGRRDDFFALGGHSLLATRLVSQVRERLDAELALSAVFAHPDLGGMARAVDDAEASAILPPIRRVDRSEPLPLSYAQARLWFLHRLTPESAAYHMPTVLRIRGRLDVGALRAALADVVQRHEVLRTRLVETATGPEQHVEASVDLPFVLEDVPDEESARARASELVRAPFTLSEAPLLRAGVLRIGDDDHVLVLVMHHVASDGWSMWILVREWSELYAARVEQREASLPALPVQYADFAVWQRRWLGDEGELERQLTFWKDQLRAAPTVLELPLDRPRPRHASDRGGTVSMTLARELMASVEALARELGATPFMVLLASWALLLSRYARTDDVVVGTPVAGRRLAEVEGLIGFFANTLALRTDLGGDPTFGELVRRVRDVTVGAYAHQDVPFEKVVAALDVPRDTSVTPLFQVMFAYETSGTDPVVAGLSMSPMPLETAPEKFDLTLMVSSGGGGSLSYDAALFDERTAARMVRHWIRLLERAVGAPGLRCESVSMLDPDERSRVLGPWSGMGRWYRGPETIHERFSRQARARGDATAVRTQAGSLTYRELEDRSSALAAYLSRRGVGAETRVGLYCERSLELLVGILGILKASGAYVPLDPIYPVERLRLVAADAGLALVLSDREDADELGLDAEVISLRPDAALRDTPPLGDAPPSAPALPQNTAYVIYTSGSTGRPKGVPISHSRVLALFEATQESFSFCAEDVWSMFHSYAFDFTVWEIWGALLYGGSLVVITEEARQDPRAFRRQLASERVTFLSQTPAAFYRLTDVEQEQPADVEPLALRCVVFGGEALELRRLRSWYERYDDARPRLVNMYGTTETTVLATHRPLARADTEETNSFIGAPLENVTLYVLDGLLQPTAIGVPGELFQGGPAPSIGYLGRPRLTAERFLPNPYGDGSGERLYRTGDVVSWTPDGDLLYVGRVDHQIQLRGFRIELGEIEAALEKAAGVARAVVVGHNHPEGLRIVAYYVAEEERSAPSPASLRSDLEAGLPSYMIPVAFLRLPAIPLTPNGKVDRRALPDPDWESVSSGRAPATENERRLAEAAAEVLGVADLGVDVSLFDAGLDSILATQLVWRAKERGMALRLRDIFELPTVEGLARIVEPTPLVGEEQGLVTGGAPLTPIQGWFFEQTLTDRDWWNQDLVLRVPSGVAPERVEEMVEALLAHHDQLRARFEELDAGWAQTVEPPGAAGALVLHEVHVGLGPDARRDAVRAMGQRLHGGLSLAEGPCVGVGYIDLGEDARLVMVIHHLVVDGVSWRVLSEDLSALWRGQTLPEKTTSFRRWAALLKERGPARFASDREHWLTQVGEEAALWETGVGHPDASEATASLDESTSGPLLDAVPARWRTTTQELLVAALVHALSRELGRDVVRLTLEGHGREDLFEDADITRTVGWFTTMYPVRVAGLEAADGDPFESLRRTKAALRDVPSRGIGYGVLRYLSDDASLAAALSYPMELTFNYLGQLDRGLSLDDEMGGAPESAGPPTHPANEDASAATATVSVSGGRLRLALEVEPGHVAPGTVERVVAAWRSALEELSRRGPSEPVRYVPQDFPLATLSRAELQELAAHAGRPIDAVYPLTPLQEGLLFETRLAGGPTYVTEQRFELVGPLDAAALRAAWQHVHARHEALRASVHYESLERPHMVVWAEAPAPLEEVDLRGAADPEAEALSRCERAVQRGFDLGRPPLSEATLLRLGEQRWWLSWRSHHLVLDGWSNAQVLGEVAAFVSEHVTGTPAPLLPAASLAPYVQWQREREARSPALDRWSERLRGAPLPTALGRRPEASEEVSSVAHFARELVLDAAASASLFGLARSAGVTNATLVQAAWAMVCSALSGQRDVTFGYVFSGRSEEVPSSESMVGMLIGTLPVRVRLDLEGTVTSLLGALQRTTLDLQNETYVPLTLVGRAAGVRPRDLFESIVAFQNYPAPPSLEAGSQRTVSVRAVGGRERPLAALSPRGFQDGDRLGVQLEAHLGLISAEVAERAFRWLRAVLDALSAAPPERELGAIEWMPEDEPRRALRALGSGPRHLASAAWRRWWAASWGWGTEAERQLAFWRRQLSGASPVLDLPLDRVPTREPEPARLDVPMSAEVMTAARALADERGATPSAILLTAWMVLLARYARTDDVVVSTIVRRREGTLPNLLPVRLSLHGHPSFRDLVGRVSEATRLARAHPDVPLERLIEALGTPPEPGRTPFTQAAFDFTEAGTGGETDASSPLTAAAVRFDLALSFDSRGAGTLAYGSELFETETAERIAEHFRALLERALHRPDDDLETVSLVREDEHAELLAWNDTKRSWASPDTLVEAFEAQVALRPNAIAVTQGDRSSTYAELDARSTRLANELAARGVGLEDRVALCVERSIEYVVGALAALKAGASYVPMDPSYPRGRLRYMLEDSGVALVLSTRGLWEALAVGVEVGVVDLAPDSSVWERPERRLEPGVGPDNAAYAIYTSGTTGRPKCSVLTHRGAVNLMNAQREIFECTGEDSVLQLAALGFDATVSEIFVTLGAGARLVLAESDRELAGAELARLIQRQGVTAVTLPTSIQATLPREDVPCLRTLVSAGEACSVEQVRRWAGATRFVNAYGPTENSVCATAHVCRGDEARVPIGRPIANVEAYVMEPALVPAPVGVVAELCVGGAQVSRGYSNRPGLTAACFMPNEAGEPGSRVYRTGDLVRRLPDGALEFFGRIDHQVKLRGFRIELGEIESRLESLPGVRQAVAKVVASHGFERLVGYLVTEAEIDEDALRAALREDLPDYMVPTVLMRLERFPVSTSGKVDRDALPEPSSPGRVDFEAPESEMEQLLARAWHELLGVERVGRNDDFFELGGHSLVVTQLVRVIRQHLDLEVGVADVFELRRLSALAERLDELRAEPAEPEVLRRPVIFLGGAGELPYAARLAAGFDARWSLVGLEPPASGAQSVEATARGHAERIAEMDLAMAPVLVAWGPGAVVATETARGAEAMGIPVELLVLLEPGTDANGPPPLPLDVATLLITEEAGLEGLRRAWGTAIDPRRLSVRAIDMASERPTRELAHRIARLVEGAIADSASSTASDA